ncbi:hypothetical protein LMQOC1_70009 [Listeria monocytogenes QOC1]|nr:hypothetical protein LMQOC1_70009 [Listeria monocytogenes QOC1]
MNLIQFMFVGFTMIASVGILSKLAYHYLVGGGK